MTLLNSGDFILRFVIQYFQQLSLIKVKSTSDSTREKNRRREILKNKTKKKKEILFTLLDMKKEIILQYY